MTLLFSSLQPNGADAGTALSIYRVVNGIPATSEFGCFFIPQTVSGAHTDTVTWKVNPGDTFLLEISATTMNAPAGAKATGGNLLITATIVK
jgi:hypothetical protein